MKNGAETKKKNNPLIYVENVVDILGNKLLAEKKSFSMSPGMIISFNPLFSIKPIELLLQTLDEVYSFEKLASIMGFALAVGNIKANIPSVDCATVIAEAVSVSRNRPTDEEVLSEGIVAISVFKDGKTVISSRQLKEVWDEILGVQDVIERNYVEDDDGNNISSNWGKEDGPLHGFWHNYKKAAKEFPKKDAKKQGEMDTLAREILKIIMNSSIGNPALKK